MTEAELIERASHLARQASSAEARADLSQAVEYTDAALALRPNWPPYLVSKGNLLRQMKNYDEAENVIRQALEADPTASYAWTELGLLYKELKSYKQAAFYLEKSATLRPDFNTFTVLAIVELTFDLKNAILHADKALMLCPDFDEAKGVRDVAKILLDGGEARTDIRGKTVSEEKRCQEPNDSIGS